MTTLPLTKLYRSEFMDELYPDISGDQWEAFKGSILVTDGAMIPISVLKISEDKYEVWDGYQRWRAHRELRIEQIKCNMLPEEFADYGEDERREWAAHMNRFRRHLKFSEKAKKFVEGSRGRGKPTGDKKSAEESAKDAGYRSVRSAQYDAGIYRNTVPAVHAAIDNKLITKADAVEIAQFDKDTQPKALKTLITKRDKDPEASSRRDVTAVKIPGSAIAQWVALRRSIMDLHSLMRQYKLFDESGESEIVEIQLLTSHSRSDTYCQKNAQEFHDIMITVPNVIDELSNEFRGIWPEAGERIE